MALSQMFSLPLPRPQDSRLLLSVSEAAQRLGIGRTTLYAEMDAGRIRWINVRARRMIPLSELKAYIDDRLAETKNQGSTDSSPSPDFGS